MTKRAFFIAIAFTVVIVAPFAAADEKLGEQPSGDFAHAPPAMQKVHTPLPVFFAYAGKAKLVTVTLRYKGDGMREYKRVTLSKMKGGWGGAIPCSDVARGVMRYYVIGSTADGTPVAGNGSAREPYWVPIRATIQGDAPRLPGQAPPKSCDDESAAEPEPPPSPPPPPPSAPNTKKLELGEACDEGAQCDSGACKAGECVDAPVKRADVVGDYARIWIGASGSIDFVPLPSGDDVCRLNAQGVPANAAGYYCTLPDGPDFPSRASTAENNTIAKGGGGSAPGGLSGRDVRAMVALDYAFSASLLVGVRLGWVFGTTTSTAASRDGHGLSTPIHLELRATYLFGEEPLARSGFAPYLFAGGGVSELDAQTTVLVTQNNVAGQRPMQAWITAGPVFVAAGGGGRFALSPRAAVLGGVRVMGAFGGVSGVLPSIAPELSVQYGF
jgi:hypothetical protein